MRNHCALLLSLQYHSSSSMAARNAKVFFDISIGKKPIGRVVFEVCCKYWELVCNYINRYKALQWHHPQDCWELQSPLHWYFEIYIICWASLTVLLKVRRVLANWERNSTTRDLDSTVLSLDSWSKVFLSFFSIVKHFCVINHCRWWFHCWKWNWWWVNLWREVCR